MSIFKRLFEIARAEFSFEKRIRGRRTYADPKDTAKTEPPPYEPPPYEPPPYEPPPEPPPTQRTRIDEYYDALEAPRGSDLKTVEKAWKAQLRKYHPDLHSKDPEQQKIAGEVTQILNQAYKELKIHLGG